MDIKLIIAILTASLAVLGFYLQYLKRGTLACPRPSNALIGPLQNYGMAITVPLSLRNPSANPIAIERFSVQVVRREKEGTSHPFQAGLQWYLCEKLEPASPFQLGTTLTVTAKGQREVVVAFTRVDSWNFASGHSEVSVWAHLQTRGKELKLCSFDVYMNDSDLAKLTSGQSLSFFQRWHGSKPEYNVLIPHERTKEAGEVA